MSEFQAFKPSGILDGKNTNDLRQDINKVLEQGIKLIVIDFQDVSFMNSSGLGALVAILKNVRSQQGDLFLCAVNEQVKMIFSLTKMDSIFKFYNSQEAFEKEVINQV